VASVVEACLIVTCLLTLAHRLRIANCVPALVARVNLRDAAWGRQRQKHSRTDVGDQRGSDGGFFAGGGRALRVVFDVGPFGIEPGDSAQAFRSP
jgi:hypothetical protein